MNTKNRAEWWVKRKHVEDLGPVTHRQARASALAIARSAGGRPRDVPEIQRRREGEPTKKMVPLFPELFRR